MNGKIKTKFAALFAVALMITVCVVPVVGGSEDVEAATTETVTISGNVYAADGTTGIVGAVVYVGNSYLTTVPQAVTTTGGAFTITTELTPELKTSTVVKVYNGDPKSPAYNLEMPTITITTVDSDITNLKFVAGTVQVTGQLVKKTATTNNAIYLEGIQIKNNGTDLTGVKTDKDGKYSFLATVGQSYALTAATADTGGISFATETFTASPGNAVQNLKATVDVIDATVSAPNGNFVIVEAATGKTNSVTSFGTVAWGINNDVIRAYAKVTYNTGAIDSAVDVATMAKYQYDAGIGITSELNIAASNARSGDISATFTVSNVITGSVYVGSNVSDGVLITPSNVTLYDTSGTTPVSLNTATIKWDKYYIGNKKTDGTVTSSYVIRATYSGYTFNDVTSGNIFSNNHVKVSGSIGTDEGFKFALTATYPESNLKMDNSKYLTGEDGKYTFYVVKGYLLIITPEPVYGQEIVYPTAVNYSAVNSDITVQPIVVSKITEYKGKVLLNGIAVGENAYSMNPFPFTISGATLNWAETEDGEEPYYTFKTTSLPEDITVTATSNNNYTYVADDSGVIAKVASPGIMTDIVVKSSEYKLNVKDSKDFGIKGVNVQFKMINGDTYSTAKTIVDLGSSTTDENGVAKAKFVIPATDAYTVKVIVSSESDYGKYNFANNGVSTYADNAVVKAENDVTYYGYYTTDGSALDGFGLTYIAKEDGLLEAYGNATIVDGMYYVIAPKDATVSIKTVKGFELSGQDANGYVTLNSSAVEKDISAKVVKDDKKYDVVDLTKPDYVKFVKISEVADDIKEGTVIVLSAEKTCYKLQNEMYGYKYSDAAVEYTFAGWYVNGKLLTEDCDASITLKENVVISAQYEEAIKVIASEEAPEAGLDTNVLILGIVVVVIALIAVVYSVISKRD